MKISQGISKEQCLGWMLLCVSASLRFEIDINDGDRWIKSPTFPPYFFSGFLLAVSD